MHCGRGPCPTSAERLLSLSERGWSVSEGAPFARGFLRAVAAEGKRLSPRVHGKPLCRCVSCFGISAM